MSSPVYKLPVEILADIFLYCVPDTLKSSPNKVAPLSFSQVSSFWRSTALETPQLWSTLAIELPSSLAEINDFDNLLDALKPYKTIANTWLARTDRYVPISIKLNYEEVEYPSFLAALSWFLSEILALYVNRLRSLTLKGSTCGAILYDIDAKLDLKTESSDTPVCLSLEKAFLIGDEDTCGHWFDRIGTVLKYSPKLRQVIFSNPLYWSNAGTIALPYSQLTHLVLAIEDISFFDWRNMMSHCTNLVWGAFAFQRPALFHFQHWLQSDVTTTEFPYLTHLHLVCRCKFFGQFVKGLNFPVLQEFSLDSRGIDTGDIESLLRLMRPIRKFILDIPGTNYASSDVTPLLKAIPDAEEIYLQIHRMDHKELFRALMPTPTNDMLPRLSLLSIYFSDMQSSTPASSFQSFPQREFLELISSRWDNRTRQSDAIDGQTCRLEEVILHIWDSGARPEEFTALDRLNREGLKAIVKMIKEKVRWKERLDIELQKAGWGDGVRLVNFSND